VYKVKTALITIGTKYLEINGMLDLITGFRYYSSFKRVHELNFCVSALVKYYPGVFSYGL